MRRCAECGSPQVISTYPGGWWCISCDAELDTVTRDDCGSSLVVQVDENPRYGPGNPDFDRDFAREEA